MKYLTRAWLIALVVMVGCISSHRTASTASIDWRARARSVHIGMTRDEVRRILPPFEPFTVFSTNDVLTEWEFASASGGGSSEIYWVTSDWQVTVTYSFRDGEERVCEPVKIRHKKFEEAGWPDNAR